MEDELNEEDKKLMEELKPIFKISLADPEMLKKSFKVIAEFVTEITLDMTTDGMDMVVMDPANVAMIIYKLLPSSCVEWEVSQKHRISLNIGHVNSVLKNCKKNDFLVIETSKEADKVDIVMRGKAVRRYNLPLIDLEDKEQKVPELNMESKVVMDSKSFLEQINEASNTSDSVEFKTEDGVFIMSGVGEIGSVKMENKADDNTRIEGNSISKYSIEYISKMAKAHTIGKDVMIEFGKEYPCRITYTEIDKQKITFILAPRVSDD